MYGVVYNNWWQGMIAWASIFMILGSGWYVFSAASKVLAMDTLGDTPASIVSYFRCDDGRSLEVTYQRNAAIVIFTIPHNTQVVLTKRAPTPPWLKYSLKNGSIVLLQSPEYAIVRENGQTTYDHCVAND
jgi:hypothetical protein